MNQIAKELYLLGCNILKNEPLKLHTTFKIGGKVPLFVIPKTKKIFVETLKYLVKRKIDFKIIGGGANLIIKNKDLNFVVISTEYLTDIDIKDDQIFAEVGVPVSRLAYFAMEKGLSGLEFAAGIPGTLGGALFMNAGAYGSQMENVVEEAEVFDLEKKEIIILNKEDIKFDYRKSIFQQRRYISLSAKLKLIKDKKENIEERIKELSLKRWEKQPLEYPSAGSMFKRPKPDFYVGTTIEKLGLKGFSIGGAQISDKHAGFIINKGDATFSDVMNLINHIRKIVKDKYGENLEIEPEIWE